MPLCRVARGMEVRSLERHRWIAVTTLGVAVTGVVVVAWAALTGWGGIVHGHPAYAVLLGATLLGSALLAWSALRRGIRRRSRGRTAGGILVLVLGIAWVGGMAWLRPHTAVEPALAAMASDDAVSISESATEIVLTPAAAGSATGVFFQPGALVDARAYAAVLRPLAEGGHAVVIAKQPLGIAFLAQGAFDGVRAGHPEISGWVLGGHSLGGTVAAIEADAADSADSSPATGLLLFASYPASDIRASLAVPVESISGTRDGLATPAKIDASRTDLPRDTAYTVIDGASHAQFGDYGPQSGDGTATISHDAARARIADASVAFIDSLDR